MTKLLCLLYVVTALLGGPALALDDSLESSFGKGRVKIRRVEAPKEISQTALQAAQARFDAQMRICRGKSDRGREYCMREADNQLMIDQRRIREKARKLEARERRDDS